MVPKSYAPKKIIHEVVIHFLKVSTSTEQKKGHGFDKGLETIILNLANEKRLNISL